MITSIGQVMIYVSDTDESAKFWKEKVGFEICIKKDAPYGGNIYEIAPQKNSDVSFVLQNKKKVAEFSPELNLGTPSVLFKSNNLEKTYTFMKENGVNVNDIADLGFMKVFNFSDNEGNYFAVTE